MKKITLFFLIASNLYSQDIEYNIKSAMDYWNPNVIFFARQIVNTPGKLNIGQICDLYDYLFSNWTYVNDPIGMEYISPASESIMHLTGDCDDYAVLMASLLASIGASSRVILTTNHAYAEVYICNDCSLKNYLKYINERYTSLINKIFGVNEVQSIYYHKDNSGNIWLNLDWTAKYPGGEFISSEVISVIYPD
jgi:hypothetical protein